MFVCSYFPEIAAMGIAVFYPQIKYINCTCVYRSKSNRILRDSRQLEEFKK